VAFKTDAISILVYLAVTEISDNLLRDIVGSAKSRAYRAVHGVMVPKIAISPNTLSLLAAGSKLYSTAEANLEELVQGLSSCSRR